MVFKRWIWADSWLVLIENFRKWGVWWGCDEHVTFVLTYFCVIHGFATIGKVNSILIFVQPWIHESQRSGCATHCRDRGEAHGQRYTIRYNDQLLVSILNISLSCQYAALSATQSRTNLGLYRCDSGEYPLFSIHIRDVHKRELSKRQNLYIPTTDTVQYTAHNSRVSDSTS